MTENMRWLCLPSGSEGRDWFERSQELDRFIAHGGLELAHESVYIYFKGSSCLVARSVIGPKKKPLEPFELIDWTAQALPKKSLRVTTWDEIPVSEAPIMVCIKRKLDPNLSVDLEVLSYE